MDFVFDLDKPQEAPKFKCVVRVSSSAFITKRGVSTRRVINVLKRLTRGVWS